MYLIVNDEPITMTAFFNVITKYKLRLLEIIVDEEDMLSKILSNPLVQCSLQHFKCISHRLSSSLEALILCSNWRMLETICIKNQVRCGDEDLAKFNEAKKAIRINWENINSIEIINEKY